MVPPDEPPPQKAVVEGEMFGAPVPGMWPGLARQGTGGDRDDESKDRPAAPPRRKRRGLLRRRNPDNESST